MITQKKLKDNACSGLDEYNELIIANYDKGELMEAEKLFMDCNTKQQNYFLIGIRNSESLIPSEQVELYSFFDNLIVA